jgi:hypothetical protein
MSVWWLLRSAALAAVFVVLAAFPAAAGGKWCEDDPLITVAGRMAHVTVGFQADDLKHLSGKIHYRLLVAQSYLASTSIDSSLATLPTETSVSVLTDEQMSRWKGDRIKVVVQVYVPAQTSFQTLTTVADAASFVIERRGGKSNSWVEVSFSLP